ncbi:MAG: DUF1501 domain-containing protein [Planctomycetaceae bacterium]
MSHETRMHLNVNRHGDVTRRSFLQMGAAGVAGSAFLSQISLNAAELKKSGRACILVWLAGAPSQMEMFDPKPGTKNGGPTKAIRTAIPGVKIAEHWPKIAAMLNDVAVIRSMKGKEAAHARGTYHLHTGRRQTGNLKFPNIGSVVAKQIGDPDSDMPNFVSVGKTLSSGFLGIPYAPFLVNRPGQLPNDVAAGVPQTRVRRRLALLKQQDADFALEGAEQLVGEHQTLYNRAKKLMNSPRLKAFTLDDEPQRSKAAYGKSQLGQGLLVARRLVEAGVPFVEVRKGGWDMHNRLFGRIKPAAADVDNALSQLLKDLKQRGMLEKTVVICMGEFGRTPKINKRKPAVGRDHWARNFNLLMAGAGIRGGAVVGKTDANGQKITDRPVAVEDFFQTLCKAMHIDADHELTGPGGRPLKIVDGGKPVIELFG